VSEGVNRRFEAINRFDDIEDPWRAELHPVEEAVDTPAKAPGGRVNGALPG
jgi:hypothetical protein